jgi:hypothetical protein
VAKVAWGGVVTRHTMGASLRCSRIRVCSLGLGERGAPRLSGWRQKHALAATATGESPTHSVASSSEVLRIVPASPSPTAHRTVAGRLAHLRRGGRPWCRRGVLVGSAAGAGRRCICLDGPSGGCYMGCSEAVSALNLSSVSWMICVPRDRRSSLSLSECE